MHKLQNFTLINPNQPGLFWRLSSPGGGGGGCSSPLQILAVDRAIAAKICIKVECNVNYKTVLLDYSLLLSFILYELIMLISVSKLISYVFYCVMNFLYIVFLCFFNLLFLFFR